MYLFVRTRKKRRGGQQYLRFRLQKHKFITKKVEKEPDLFDMRECSAEHWAVISNKRYQGLQSEISTAIPKQNPAQVLLAYLYRKSYQRIDKDCDVVKYYFRGLTKLSAVLSSRFKWKKKLSFSVYRYRVALTNQHIVLHPLQSENRPRYMLHRKQLYRNNILAKNKKSNRRKHCDHFRATMASAQDWNGKNIPSTKKTQKTKSWLCKLKGSSAVNMCLYWWPCERWYQT